MDTSVFLQCPCDNVSYLELYHKVSKGTEIHDSGCLIHFRAGTDRKGAEQTLSNTYPGG